MTTIKQRPKVLITRKLPRAVERRLGDNYEVILNSDDRVMPGGEILDMAKDADALLISITERADAGFIERLPSRVKIIATFSVGFDHIDVGAAAKRGIAVTNTPDVLTDATADLAMLLLLGAARGANWGMAMVREDKWPIWSPTWPLGIDVTGKNLGIIGMGRIGRALARRARGFDMRIHYFNRSRPEPDLEEGAQYHSEIDTLLPVSNFLSINCAMTPQTSRLLNEKTIAKLPKGAVVINTARGGIIDDDALIAALESGHLAAAGLDVFDGEPDIDPRYRDLDNVFALPHLGSATPETREAMGMRAADNLDAFFAGKTPPDLHIPTTQGQNQ